jgi:hypothetical protein
MERRSALVASRELPHRNAKRHWGWWCVVIADCIARRFTFGGVVPPVDLVLGSQAAGGQGIKTNLQEDAIVSIRADG